MSTTKFGSSLSGVNNVELNKIIIDWGDGTKTKLNRPINHTISTISNLKEDDWKKASHTFNIDKRNIYLTDDSQFLPKITIKIYSTFNDVVNIIIPYKIVYKSLYDLGTGFELLQANISNNNLTQFVMKEGVNDSITIVSTKDWKKIYGDVQDIAYIQDNRISIDYSDEYVNIDNIVWDWASVPYVIIDSLIPDSNNNTITGHFVEKNIVVDSWTPYCEQMLDNNGNITFSKYEKYVDNTFIFQEVDATNALYRIRLEVTGINDVTGYSDYFYVPSSTFFGSTLNSLNCTYNSDIYTYTFSFKNPDVQWCHLKSAKMFLKPISWAANDSVYSSEIKELGLSTSNYQDGDSSYLFEYPITNNGVTIDPYSLPNGEYEISYKIEDLLNNVTDTVGDGTDDGIDNTPKKHTIKVENFPTPSKPSVTQSEQSEFIIPISWNVTSSKMDKVVLRITDSNSNQVVNLKQPYDKNSDIKHKVNNEDNNIHTFSYTLDGNTIPDGKLKVQVANCVDMTDFIGCRQSCAEYDYDYSYPTPKIGIKTINVHPYWNGKVWETRFRITCDSNNNKLKNIKFINGNTQFYVSQASVYSLNTTKLPNIGTEEYTNCEIQSAYESDVHNRLGIGSSKEITKNSSIDTKYHIRPTWSEDLLDVSKNYIGLSDKEITGTEAQAESAFDIYKGYSLTYSYNNNDYTFYSPVESPTYYNVDNKKCWYLYRNATYKSVDSTEESTRFFNDGEIIVIDEDDSITLKPLDSLTDFINSKGVTVSSEYDKTTDTCSLTFTCPDKKLAEQKQIQVGYLYIYNSAGTQIVKQDIRKSFHFTIPSLTPGVYSWKIVLSSLLTSNIPTDESNPDSGITFTPSSPISALVPNESALSSSATSFVSPINPSYKMVRINYTIHHKQLDTLKLFYKIANGTEKYVNLNSIQSSFYELPDQITPGTTVTYYFKGKSSVLNNPYSEVIIGKLSSITT